MNQTAKTIAEAYVHRIWDKKDISAIDELVHPQVLIHSLLGDFQGRDPLKTVVKAWTAAFPDLVVRNAATICENDLVVTRWQAKGTHLGEFKGMKATGKQVAYEGVTIYRVDEGQIKEYWAYLDMHHLLGQIS